MIDGQNFIYVLMLILHVFRMYLSGGIKRTRVMSVVLAVLTASFSITGYSLPRDQIGYWGSENSNTT